MDQIDKVKTLIRDRTARAELPLDERRTLMDRNVQVFPLPADVRVEPADLGGLAAEWAIPGKADPGRALLYFHGGGYVIGSPASHRHLTGRLAIAARARVLSVDYRLAPEHPFPAAVNDGLQSYRWMLDQGMDPHHLAVGGDSAGGGLALAALLRAREEGLAMPAAVIALSPWTDLTCESPTYESRRQADPMIEKSGITAMAELYLHGADPRNPLASPLFADLTGLPPLLIQVGNDEVLLDDAREIERRARAAGVDARLEVWERMFHVWQAFYQMLPEGEDAIGRLGAFLTERWLQKS